MATQGKNKRKQLEVYDDVHQVTLSVDSMEEVDFSRWCCEAVQLSILNDFIYQPGTFQLYESENYIDVNGKSRCLFRDHVYSPDFLITFDPNRYTELAKEFKVHKSALSSNECSVWIDTKGAYNPNARSFSTDRKWIWQKFGIYICEVVPKKFCQKFGCALKSFYQSKTNKVRKIFAGCKSICESFGLKKTKTP